MDFLEFRVQTIYKRKVLLSYCVLYFFMEDISLISDSHIPSRASEIPSWVVDNIKKSDYTIHAGDFDSKEAFNSFQELSNLVCVSGNMDSFLSDIPDVNVLEIEGVQFIITHGTGPSRTYKKRVRELVEKTGDMDKYNVVGIAGHTHEIMDTVVDGVRMLNPGSCTGAAPATSISMMSVRVEGRGVDVDVLEK